MRGGSIKHPDPKFPTRPRIALVSSEVAGIVNSVIGDRLTEWLEEHPREARSIINKSVLARELPRGGAQSARDGAAQRAR